MFKGEGSWRKHKQHLELLCKLHGDCSDEFRLLNMVKSFKDRALDWYLSLAEETQECYLLTCEAMAKKFDSKLVGWARKKKVIRSLQRPGESVGDFVDRLLVAGRTEFSSTPEEEVEEMLVNIF